MTAITASMVKELRESTGAAMMDCKKALTECGGGMEEAKEFLRKKGQAIADKKSSRETKEGAICIEARDNMAAVVKVACETDFVARNEDFQKFISDIAKQALEVGGKGDLMEQTTSNGSIKEQFVEAVAKMGENIVYVDGTFWEAPANSVIGSYTHSNGKIGVLVELELEGDGDKDQASALAKDLSMHVAASNVEAVSENDLNPAVLEKERNFLIDQAKDSGKPANIVEKMVEGRMKKYKKEICLLDQPFVKEPDKSITQVVEEASKQIGTSAKVKRFYKITF